MPTAIVTGGSAGLGRALGRTLAGLGWRLVIDGRSTSRLERAAAEMRRLTDVVAVPGDVTDPAHRAALAASADLAGGPDLLVNNASTLGPSPLPSLEQLSPDDLRVVLATNVEAPHALTRLVLPALLRRRGIVLNVSSDAAVEHYPGWGAYAASKAALDHLTLTLAGENPEIAAYAVDPGDMRTEMHQRAFPDEDIGDRPEPGSVVPALVSLLRDRPASGRYRAADLPAVADQADAQAATG